jgi:hypothetical protein
LATKLDVDAEKLVKKASFPVSELGTPVTPINTARHEEDSTTTTDKYLNPLSG